LLLSALINDTLPPLDPAPFRASRFAM